MDPGGFRTPKQKEQEQDKKNTTPSATALFFCSVLYNTTLPSYRLPQLWCAIHVVPGQQRGNAKRTATTSTGCFLLNFSNGSCWQRGREREASSASSASSATKTQTRRIKKSKEKKTHSLTCNPFNRGCIFDRQAMTLATKASFVDQDLTRHTRMQTQNTKKYNTATSVLPNPRGTTAIHFTTDNLRTRESAVKPAKAIATCSSTFNILRMVRGSCNSCVSLISAPARPHKEHNQEEKNQHTTQKPKEPTTLG